MSFYAINPKVILWALLILIIFALIRLSPKRQAAIAKYEEEREKQRQEYIDFQQRLPEKFEKWLREEYQDAYALELYHRAGDIIYIKDFAESQGIEISEADCILHRYGTYIEEEFYEVTSTGEHQVVIFGAYEIMPKEEFYVYFGHYGFGFEDPDCSE